MPIAIPSTRSTSPGSRARLGFAQVSASHEVSPLIKLVGRGDTTVVDAYLVADLCAVTSAQVDRDLDASGRRASHVHDVIRRTDRRRAVPGQGCDSLRSGRRRCRHGGNRRGKRALQKLIGFDMGGTSTDVSHFDGEYERAFETEVAGVRMRAPMMLIHTVAAGGGSILHFDGARFRVGPDSAGANPGPKCYRRGGPLAVTDANVMVGKLIAGLLPEDFRPVAESAARRATRCAKRSPKLRSRSAAASAEEVADGFIKIAVENMANAIKKISVQRGYDVTRYALNCFGGAGGQHACLVADALGMTRVLIHPFSSSFPLTAWGLPISAPHANRPSNCRLRPQGAQGNLSHWRGDSAKRQIARWLGQGVPPQEIKVYRARAYPLRRHRYGACRACRQPAAMKRAFEKAHKARFGFIDRAKQLVVEAVSVGGGWRRRQIQREDDETQPRHTAASGAAYAVFLRRRLAQGKCLSARPAQARIARQWRRHHHRAASDRSWSSPAGKPN